MTPSTAALREKLANTATALSQAAGAFMLIEAQSPDIRELQLVELFKATSSLMREANDALSVLDPRSAGVAPKEPVALHVQQLLTQPASTDQPTAYDVRGDEPDEANG